MVISIKTINEQYAVAEMTLKVTQGQHSNDNMSHMTSINVLSNLCCACDISTFYESAANNGL